MPIEMSSAFISEQLRYVRRQIIEFPLPEYLGANGMIVPLSGEIPVGATSYVYYIRTLVGEAAIISNPADDLPTADVYVEQKSGIIHDVGDSYRYSDKDLENAAFSGMNLTMSKATAAKQAAMIKLDKICFIGDTKYNLLGLLNQPNVPVASILADGVGGSTRWATKTPTQVLRDLRDLSTLIPIETNLVERPDTLLLPPLQYFYLSQTYKDPMSDMTLMEAFLRTQGANGIQNVEMVPYLAGKGAGGTDMGILYRRREDKVKLHVPMPFTPKRPQERNLHYVVPCRYTTGGVEVTFPMSLRYFQGI
jgi:hypothetical protein